jgi:putative flippase GtrA
LLAPGRIEIASLIAYVAGTGASFVTNAAFTIDGYLG